jgi:hypothetical protein
MSYVFSRKSVPAARAVRGGFGDWFDDFFTSAEEKTKRCPPKADSMDDCCPAGLVYTASEKGCVTPLEIEKIRDRSEAAYQAAIEARGAANCTDTQYYIGKYCRDCDWGQVASKDKSRCYDPEKRCKNNEVRYDDGTCGPPCKSPDWFGRLGSCRRKCKPGEEPNYGKMACHKACPPGTEWHEWDYFAKGKDHLSTRRCVTPEQKKQIDAEVKRQQSTVEHSDVVASDNPSAPGGEVTLGQIAPYLAVGGAAFLALAFLYANQED